VEESARHAREPDVIRLCLDVNVWVGHYLTMSRRPRAPGAMSGLARAVLAGACGAGQIQLVVSHAIKQFFFEKKNQKTFAYWARACGQSEGVKVFCFFFSKKKTLL